MSLHSDNDSQHLTITAPEATEIATGPYTVAVLYKNLPSTGCYIWNAWQPDDFDKLNLYFDGDAWVDFTVWDGNLDISSAEWRWLVVTKSADTEPPGVHIGDYVSSGAISWVHTNVENPRENWNPIDRISIGNEFGPGFQGDLAVIAAYESELSNAAIEAAFVRSSSQILATAPQFFVHWPEAAGLGSPFEDIAGGGVETIRSGTWSMSDDPDGFNFSLGRSGKPKVWSGTSWDPHQASVWNGSVWVPHPMAGYNGTEFVESK